MSHHRTGPHHNLKGTGPWRPNSTARKHGGPISIRRDGISERRLRRQNGSLSIKGKVASLLDGGMESVPYREDMTLRRLHKAANLGYCAEVSEGEARAKLRLIMDEIQEDPIPFPTSKRSRQDSMRNGAAAEMLACWHLMQKGFEVFKALNPGCRCDLIAMDSSGKLHRVEVKLAPMKVSGEPNVDLTSKINHFDLLIVVTPKGKIFERTYAQAMVKYSSEPAAVAPQGAPAEY